MNATDAYAAAAQPLSAVLDAVPATAWDAPSPCAGWSARDVVAHVVATQRELLTTHGAELGPAPDLADPAADFRAHSTEVLGLVGELADRAYDGFFGPTTVGATLEQFYV